jgi:hypothetical protein
VRGEVLVAVSLVGAAVVVDADGGGQLAAGRLAHGDVAGADAVEVAVEVDDAAGVAGLACTARDRLVLDHAALAGVGRHLQQVGPEAPFVGDAALQVVDALAGVVGEGGGLDAARVAWAVLHLRPSGSCVLCCHRPLTTKVSLLSSSGLAVILAKAWSRVAALWSR